MEKEFRKNAISALLIASPVPVLGEKEMFDGFRGMFYNKWIAGIATACSRAVIYGGYASVGHDLYRLVG